MALGHCVKPGNMAQFIWLTIPLKMCRLGIELTKIMVLQYSNQETSVTIGESVRDEDGIASFSAFLDSRVCGISHTDRRIVGFQFSSCNLQSLTTSMMDSWSSSS